MCSKLTTRSIHYLLCEYVLSWSHGWCTIYCMNVFKVDHKISALPTVWICSKLTTRSVHYLLCECVQIWHKVSALPTYLNSDAKYNWVFFVTVLCVNSDTNCNCFFALYFCMNSDTNCNCFFVSVLCYSSDTNCNCFLLVFLASTVTLTVTDCFCVVYFASTATSTVPDCFSCSAFCQHVFFCCVLRSTVTLTVTTALCCVFCNNSDINYTCFFCLLLLFLCVCVLFINSDTGSYCLFFVVYFLSTVTLAAACFLLCTFYQQWHWLLPVFCCVLFINSDTGCYCLFSVVYFASTVTPTVTGWYWHPSHTLLCWRCLILTFHLARAAQSCCMTVSATALQSPSLPFWHWVLTASVS